MRRTRSGRADRRPTWRRVAPRSSAAGVSRTFAERTRAEPSPFAAAVSRQPSAVSWQPAAGSR
eukprot:CAMPEP_0185421412 /NCGR_PEP_ID=MMETSP1365-20130426/10993_1 /TAXON_ID=38817 /ORGANISM="Gephyrocapsa oceanica, Strain RCC1303" /LENGTH=62 /DNA_ID=CAMNT_0028025121 /DNA_START=82 /DNA_END=266 /DNA_ORIENTATION=+